MSRTLLLASIAVFAIGVIPSAKAQEVAVAVETVPAPPQPRGLLGGLFKRKQRPVEVPAELLLSLEEATAAPAGDAPIDLIPPDTAVIAEPDAPPVKKPTFVLRKVPDEQVPLPHPNPRREISTNVAVVLDAGADQQADPVAAELTPSFEPDVPPPASAASMPDAGGDQMPPSPEAFPETTAADEKEMVTLAEPTPANDMGAEAASDVVAKPNEEPAAVVEPPVVAEPVLAEPQPGEAARSTEPDPDPAISSEPQTEPMPDSADTGSSEDMDQRMAAEVLVAAAHDADSPRALVELLIRAQDAIAAGSVPALAAQRRIRAEIDRTFADAEPGIWQDPTNTVAAATYVFSGGTPDVLRRLATLDPKPAGDERLWRGALAYVEGRQGEAAGMLLGLEIRDLPASIGGQVALAQAALLVGTDPHAALERLDMARLVAPGTLVEEAAIRRSLLVTEQLHDQERFAMLVRQYLARFRHSIYAGNFRYRFAAALTRSPLLDDPTQFPQLDAMLAQLEPDARRSHYLTVASAAVVSGKMAAATYAAEQALSLARPESPDQSRARLYRSAALFLDAETFDSAEADFEAINVAMLDPADRALHDAVAQLAEAIGSGVDPEVLSLLPASGPMPGDEGSDDADPLVERAKALAGEVDVVLADAS